MALQKKSRLEMKTGERRRRNPDQQERTWNSLKAKTGPTRIYSAHRPRFGFHFFLQYPLREMDEDKDADSCFP
jgi:hypothetical protein